MKKKFLWTCFWFMQWLDVFHVNVCDMGSYTLGVSCFKFVWSNVDSNSNSVHIHLNGNYLSEHTVTPVVPVAALALQFGVSTPPGPGYLSCPPCQSVSGMPTNPFVKLPCRIGFLGPPEIWVNAGLCLFRWYQTLDGVQVSQSQWGHEKQ